MLTTTADRSQVVLIQRVAPEGGVGEWVRIDSVVGLVDDLDLAGVMRATAESGFGGLVVIEDEVLLRHLLPLQNPFLGELDRPIHLAVRTADRLEHRFSGRDRH